MLAFVSEKECDCFVIACLGGLAFVLSHAKVTAEILDEKILTLTELLAASHANVFKALSFTHY